MYNEIDYSDRRKGETTMKKTLCVFVSTALLFSMTACSSSNPPATSSIPNTTSPQTVTPTPAPTQNATLQKSCADIIDYLYANATKTEALDAMKERAQLTEITAENCYWFLGKEGISFESAYASESPISPSNYSLCVVKVKEGDDVDAVKKAINDNLQVNKWVCMGADEKMVESIDNVILVVLSDKDTINSLKDAFFTLK